MRERLRFEFLRDGELLALLANDVDAWIAFCGG
jgi:hypothetical protein